MILTPVTPDEDVRGKTLVVHAGHEITGSSWTTFHRKSVFYDWLVAVVALWL
jgi:hypothetical protein